MGNVLIFYYEILLSDTESNIRLLIVLFKNRATNKQQNECNRVVSKRRWMG